MSGGRFGEARCILTYAQRHLVVGYHSPESRNRSESLEIGDGGRPDVSGVPTRTITFLAKRPPDFRRAQQPSHPNPPGFMVGTALPQETPRRGREYQHLLLRRCHLRRQPCTVSVGSWDGSWERNDARNCRQAPCSQHPRGCRAVLRVLHVRRCVRFQEPGLWHG